MTGFNWGAVDAYLRPIRARMAMNLEQTGHPFHHLTASGVVVESDPWLDRDELTHLWLAGISVGVPEPSAHPERAVPTIADWYNTAAGRTWRKQRPILRQRAMF